MADAFVQRIASTTHGASSSAFAVAVSTAPSAGNTLLLGVRASSTVVLSSVTDSKGNTWTVDQTQTAGTTGRVSAASTQQDVAALTTSDTITVHLSGASSNTPVAVFEYSGLLSAVDVSASHNGNSAAPTTGSLVTTHADDMIVSWVGAAATESTASVDSSFVKRDTGQTSVNPALLFAELPVEATGTYSATWTLNNSASWGCVTVAYKASSSVLSYSFSLSDSTVATESLIAGRSFPRSVSDTATAAETLTRQVSLTRTIANASAAADTVARTLSFSRSVSSTTPAVDTAAGSPGRTKNVTDTSLAADTATAVSIRSLTRTAVVSGLYPDSGLYPQGDIYPGGQGDSSLAADTAALTTSNPRPLSDSTLATDTLTRSLALIRSFADTTLAADTATRLTNLVRTVVASTLASDAATAGAIGLTRTATDQSVAVDGPSVAFSSGSHRGVLDFTTLEDVASRGSAFVVAVADQAGAVDVAAHVEGHGRTLSEATAAADTVGYGLGTARTASDASALSDSAIVLLTYLRGVADSTLALDTAGRAIPFIRNLAEQTALTDTAVGFGVYSLQAVDTSLASDTLVVVAFTTHRGNIIVTVVPSGPLVSTRWDAIDTQPAVVTVGH